MADRNGADHLIGSPLALASKEYATKAWTRFQDLPALKTSAASFTQGSITSLDLEKKVATIKDSSTGSEYEETYDYLVGATGLRRVWPVVPQSLSQEDYRKEVYEHVAKVTNAKEGVVVVGGGKSALSHTPVNLLT